jgi:hypothetical protein
VQIVALGQTRHLRPFSGSIRKTKDFMALCKVYRTYCVLL